MRQEQPRRICADLAPNDALARVSQCLHDAGIAEAFLDARIFLEEATGFNRASLLRAPMGPIGTSAADRLGAWVKRRVAGEPLWRILGQREFWGLPFSVTPDVLDPRPDTETLVSAALATLGLKRTSPLRILDLGIGSGVLLAALLTECPSALGWGVDRSGPASRVAQDNLVALGLGGRALVLNGSWSDALAAGQFDLVVSNPPYIETAVIPTLQREVREHDPHAALDGGPDGLACYRAIAADLPRLLRAHGLVVLEAGAGQAASVETLLRETGLAHEATHRDLGGHLRAVVARRP